ncbi:GTPase ObgE [Mycoplasmoides pneumoniae]|uniref:GTPase ObgE n=1 Tax=Mycoplasmoides pneumoniae TaxID=2104 RepID=UPI0006BA13F5|nr:GTPase ObgE [Mycoplasmoides pneumoniae]
MGLTDYCECRFSAGNGGNGIIAWRREAHYDKGGPGGGNGGNGGNVVLQADHNCDSLFFLKNKKHLFAESGGNGKPDLAHGKNGEDLVIKVPVGTTVRDLDTKQILMDFVHDQQSFILCYGGKGGKGNAAFKSPIMRAPNLYENGDKGQSLHVSLEIKYLANVGIVGFPNTGKSTLISKLSNAKPKIANYRFTTLVPVLGVVKHNDQSLVFADIPGLIENASEGSGLGHYFLRHIERCEILIHLISLDPVDHDDPCQAYEQIMRELSKYSQLLVKKKMLVVANKTDVDLDGTRFQKLAQYLENKGIPLFKISALKQELGDLVAQVFALHQKTLAQFGANKFHLPMEMEKHYVFEQASETDHDPLNIERDALGRWHVECKRLHYWFDKIPQTTLDNIRRLGNKIKEVGIEDQLKVAGAKKGDVIVFAGQEFVIND